MVRHPALQGRRDANEPAIIAALHEAGAFVLPLVIGGGVPDLLVYFAGCLYLMEVKTPKGTLNRKQKAWIEAYPGTVHIVRCECDALAVIGALPLDDRFRRCQGDDYAR